MLLPVSGGRTRDFVRRGNTATHPNGLGLAFAYPSGPYGPPTALRRGFGGSAPDSSLSRHARQPAARQPSPWSVALDQPRFVTSAQLRVRCRRARAGARTMAAPPRPQTSNRRRDRRSTHVRPGPPAPHPEPRRPRRFRRWRSSERSGVRPSYGAGRVPAASLGGGPAARVGESIVDAGAAAARGERAAFGDE
jgi:hypothetical protein